MNVQRYIKKMSKGETGIFYLPKLNAYSAKYLVDNPSKVLKVGHLGTKYVEWVEYGSLEYVTGELRLNSAIYLYKLNGRETHAHSLEEVYRDIIKGGFEFIEPVEKYFSEIQVEMINDVITYVNKRIRHAQHIQGGIR